MIVTMIDGVTLQYGMLDLAPGSHLLGSAHMVWPILATQIKAIARLERYMYNMILKRPLGTVR